MKFPYYQRFSCSEDVVPHFRIQTARVTGLGRRRCSPHFERLFATRKSRICGDGTDVFLHLLDSSEHVQV